MLIKAPTIRRSDLVASFDENVVVGSAMFYVLRSKALQRLSTATMKSLADLVPGELFRANGTDALCLFIEHVSDNEQIVGFLTEEDGKKILSWAKGNLGGRCLSYGTDWILQETHDAESLPSNSFNHLAKGKTLFIVDSDVLFAFQPSDELEHSAVEFNITRNTRSQLPLVSVPVSNWSIWENAAVQNSQGTAPLYTYAPPLPDHLH
jgi:hypothetical protein